MKTFFLILVISFFSSCFNDYTIYDKFLKPSITNYKSKNMLVYKIKGNPNETAKIAISQLYKSFYKIKRKYKLNSSPPHAKWITAYELPKDDWIGKFAIELNDSINSLPDFIEAEFPFLTIERWREEDYSEVLHVGNYNSINITSKKLKTFISQAGYVIDGFHEEIYIKGPGIFFKGNPQKYITLIRYPVRKIN